MQLTSLCRALVTSCLGLATACGSAADDGAPTPDAGGGSPDTDTTSTSDSFVSSDSSGAFDDGVDGGLDAAIDVPIDAPPTDAKVDAFVPTDSGPGSCATRPTLTPGIWKNLTPPSLALPVHPTPYGLAFVEIDPSDMCTLYVTSDLAGVFRTRDGGSTWVKLGDPAKMGAPTTSYLDSPIAVRVDPKDGKHLYATQGVRGVTQGFWVSRDGGDTWTLPAGFLAASTKTTRDVTTLAIDPTDFAHILVGSHSAWPGITNAGILESKDGGDTFIVHAPIPEFNSGSMGINFLFDPAHGVGDGRTWLVGTDGKGLWRTTDAGDHFTRVSPTTGWPDFSITHGGQQLYYASNGDLYAGAFVYPVKSKDNGLTWTALDKLPYASYYSVMGDGTTLFTQLSFTGDNGGHGPQPYMTSPETDGVNWKAYDPLGKGAQTFTDGPFVMRFDAANRILYSANWDAGLWALKVP